jgi:hypothetical protein
MSRRARHIKNSSMAPALLGQEGLDTEADA